MIDDLKICAGLVLQENKPQDIPYSQKLLLLLLAVAIVGKLSINFNLLSLLKTYGAYKENVFPARVVINTIIMQLATMFGFIYAILRYYAKQVRLTQVLSATLTVDIFFSSICIFAVNVMKFLPVLNLNNISSILIVMVFMLLSWQIMLYGHVFKHSFDKKTSIARLMVIVYMLAQCLMSKLVQY